MVKYVLFISLLINTHILMGQYIPMLKDGTEWYGYWNFEGSKYNSHDVVHGDTTINNKDYKIVLGYINSIHESTSFYREDTVEEKLYQYGFGISEDILVYDFGIEVNDTFYFVGFPYIIDSITNKYSGGNNYVINVSERTRFYYSGNILLWIEGIGNLSTLIGKDILTCHLNSEGGKDIFTDNIGGIPIVDCKGDIKMSNDDLIQNQSILLTPNPSNSFIHLEVKNKSVKKEVTVYDFSGMKISEFSFQGLGYDFDISNFSNGQYFVRVSVDGTIIGLEKLVKY